MDINFIPLSLPVLVFSPDTSPLSLFDLNPNKERKRKQRNSTNGVANGGHGRVDWSVRTGAPLPSLFRRHDSGELSLALRAQCTGEAPLRCAYRSGALLPLLWILVKSPFYYPHDHWILFHAFLSQTLWHTNFLRRIWLSHWLVISLKLKILFVPLIWCETARQKI